MKRWRIKLRRLEGIVTLPDGSKVELYDVDSIEVVAQLWEEKKSGSIHFFNYDGTYTSILLVPSPRWISVEALKPVGE